MTFDAPEPWRPEPAAAGGTPGYYGSRSATPAERPKLRPPIGVPTPRARRLPSVLLSVALHALLVVLLLVPLVAPGVIRQVTGAGEEGPAGGGGGGQRGTGGDNGGWDVRERLHMIQIRPPATPAAPAVTPPVTTPTPTPPVPPPPVPPPVSPPAQPAPTPAPAASTTAAAAGVAAPVPGAGGGTGADGTLGNGPGSGGGIGSGVGTGRGSGIGPGTGGQGGANYSPTPIEMFIPPLPLPRKVAGARVVAVFDVDSTGRILSVDFTPTADGGYNRKLRDVFNAFRFRPGTRPDGTPVRAKASFEYEL